MVKPPGYYAFQKAARRLIGPKALVYFSSRRLGDGIWGTAFKFKDYLVVQIRPGLSFEDKIRTLLHECFHHLDDDCPRLEKIGGKLQFTGLKKDWCEHDIYREEYISMLIIEDRWSRIPKLNPDLFKVAPGLEARYARSLLDCVY